MGNAGQAMRHIAIDQCVRASEPELKRFEQQFGRPIPKPFRIFLLDVCNGGHPSEALYFSVPSLNDASELHGFYGIRYDQSSYDLVVGIQYFDEVPRSFFPIAFDSTGGELLIHETTGAVHFLAHDVPDINADFSVSLVAPSLEVFLDRLVSYDSL